LRFLVLGAIFLIPGYLATIQGYRATDTGAALLWLIAPELVAGLAAARLMKHLDGRLVAGLGFAMVAIACLADSRLTSDWNGESFWAPQIFLACGLAMAFIGMIGMLNQQAMSTCAGQRPANILTYLAFFQVVRLLGGQASVVTLQRFVALREKFHSNMLGLNVRLGDWLTDERLNALAAGVSSISGSAEEAQQKAATLLSIQLSRQAFTLAYIDGFVFVAYASAIFLFAMALMKPMRIYFDATSLDPPG
jgi:DHA2 family multidrug resistance protein